MTAELLTALTVFAFVAAATPGPNNMMLLASGVNYGFRRTIPHMAGITIGFAVMIALIGFGIGQMFERLPWLYDALRGISIAYMLWLAWHIANAGAITPDALPQDARPMTFLEAAAFQWVNPKAWATCLTGVAAYTLPINFAVSMIVVTSVFALVTVPSISMWTLFGVSLRNFLADPRRVRIFNVAMALALVASLWPVVAEYSEVMSMMLVGQYDSPYVRRVAVSLHALGMSFMRNPLSVFGDAAAMRKINPIGRVPALILDDGEVLIDSGAILDHLDEVAGPGRALLPRGGAERRKALRTIGVATGGMDKAVAIVYERFLRPPTAQHRPWLERCQVQLGEALMFLEGQPSGGRLEQGSLGQADITTACLLGFLNLRVADAFAAGAYPRLERLAAEAEALPAFKAARPSADDMPPSAAKA